MPRPKKTQKTDTKTNTTKPVVAENATSAPANPPNTPTAPSRPTPSPNTPTPAPSRPVRPPRRPSTPTNLSAVCPLCGETYVTHNPPQLSQWMATHALQNHLEEFDALSGAGSQLTSLLLLRLYDTTPDINDDPDVATLADELFAYVEGSSYPLDIDPDNGDGDGESPDDGDDGDANGDEGDDGYPDNTDLDDGYPEPDNPDPDTLETGLEDLDEAGNQT